MKILVIVNVSPWAGSIAVTGLRLTRAFLGHGHDIAAVYFRDEGVYQAIGGRATDAGTPVLRDAWADLSRERGMPLLLCSGASRRRLAQPPDEPFREAGLAEVLGLMRSCDRVVSF